MYINYTSKTNKGTHRKRDQICDGAEGAGIGGKETEVARRIKRGNEKERDRSKQ